MRVLVSATVEESDADLESVGCTEPVSVDSSERVSVSADEAQRSDPDVNASAAMINAVGTDKSSSPKNESSLSKDSQRRREETLVSVTLRSV